MTTSNIYVNMIIIDFFPSKRNGLVSLSGDINTHVRAYSRKVSKSIYLFNKY